MGQYWYWVNLTKKEYISTHEFGSGLKYAEHICSGSAMYPALMLLQTDKSSMGDGGGDIDPSKMPIELGQIASNIMGRWAGDSIVLAGDYTKVDAHIIYRDGKELFEDISVAVAAAVRALEFAEIFEDEFFTTRTASDIKQDYIKYHLKKNIDDLTIWEDKPSVQKVFLALDSYEKRAIAEREQAKAVNPKGKRKVSD